MENQTRFDLNAALGNWRTELAAQPGLSSDERRELETHLRDTFAELKSRGLGEEESFWLARRRVGQPQKLAEEFVKADPTRAWRERMFWLVLTLLVIRLWSMFAISLLLPFFSPGFRLEYLLPKWVLFYLPGWLNGLPGSVYSYFPIEAMNLLLPLIIVFLLLRGKNQKLRAAVAFTLKSRTRLIFYLIALVALDYMATSSINSTWNALMAKVPFHTNFFYSFRNYAFDLFCLITLAGWLMPAQKRAARRSA